MNLKDKIIHMCGGMTAEDNIRNTRELHELISQLRSENEQLKKKDKPFHVNFVRNTVNLRTITALVGRPEQDNEDAREWVYRDIAGKIGNFMLENNLIKFEDYGENSIKGIARVGEIV